MSWDWFTGEVTNVPSFQCTKKEKEIMKDYVNIAKDRKQCIAEIKTDPNVLFRVIDQELDCMCGGTCCDCTYEDVTFFDLMIRSRTLDESDLECISRELKHGDLDWFKISSKVPLTLKTLRKHADQVDWKAVSGIYMYKIDGPLVDEFHDRLDFSIIRSQMRHCQLLYDEVVEFVFRRKIFPIECAIAMRLFERAHVEENLEPIIPYVDDLLFHSFYGAKFIDSLEDSNGRLEAMLMTIADKFAKSCILHKTYEYCPVRYADVVITATSNHILEEFIEKSLPSLEFVDRLFAQRPITKKMWNHLSTKLKLAGIEKYADHVDWNELAKRGVVVPRERWQSLKPEILSKYVKLDAEYIDEHANELDWYELCEHQILPEDTLRKHKDKLNWGQVSWYQDLSRSFINEFKNMLNFEKLGKKNYKN